MHEHWIRKRERSVGNDQHLIDKWYERASTMAPWAANWSERVPEGFLLFYASDPSALRTAMTAEGLQEVRFNFDLDGSVVLARD